MLLYLVHDDILDELVDVGLVQQMVALGRDGDERRPEADRKVKWVHHVLIRVLCQTVKETKQNVTG